MFQACISSSMYIQPSPLNKSPVQEWRNMEFPPVMFHLSSCFKHGAVFIHGFKFNLYLSPKYCTKSFENTDWNTRNMVGVGSSTLSLNITRLTSKPLYSGCSARGNSLASMVQQLSAYHRNNDPLDFTVAPTEDHLFPESKANGECNGGHLRCILHQIFRC